MLVLIFSFHCSLHYDTESGLGEEEYLKTLSEARNQDILGQDQNNETIPRNLNQTPFAAQPLLGSGAPNEDIVQNHLT